MLTPGILHIPNSSLFVYDYQNKLWKELNYSNLQLTEWKLDDGRQVDLYSDSSDDEEQKISDSMVSIKTLSEKRDELVDEMANEFK